MRKFLRVLLWTALIIGVVIGIARALAIRWVRVPSGDPYLEASVAPSLSGGDLIVLWRLTKPSFGDLVVCPEPNAPDRIVIARVAGEAGDRVRVDETNLYVNERQAESDVACEDSKFTVKHPTTGLEIEQRCDIEAVGGISHRRGKTGGHGVKPRPMDLTVERDKLVLVSDNRLLPYDSRDFGQVDAESCKETVVFRLVSRKGFFDVASRFTYVR